MNVLHSALLGVGGIMALMALWLGVQYLARREAPHTPADKDMLEFMLHRCHACEHASACTEEPDPASCARHDEGSREGFRRP